MTTNSQSDTNLFLETIQFQSASYLVNGGSQTGTSLVINGGTGSIHQGQTFTVAGVSGTYTVTSVTSATLTDVSLATTVTTVKFTPTLAAAPSDDAALTLALTFPLPSRTILNDITIVNQSTSNTIAIATNATNIAHGFVLAAGAAVTLEVTNADFITVKGAATETISMMGS